MRNDTKLDKQAGSVKTPCSSHSRLGTPLELLVQGARPSQVWEFPSLSDWEAAGHSYESTGSRQKLAKLHITIKEPPAAAAAALHSCKVESVLPLCSTSLMGACP